MLATKENLERRRNICNTLKNKLIENLDIPYKAADLRDDVSLIGAGLGFDSLDILEVVLCVENNFGVKVPELSTPILRSFNTVVDYIITEQDKKCAN